jgi:phosphohistidine swiveling domain-containing protein
MVRCSVMMSTCLAPLLLALAPVAVHAAPTPELLSTQFNCDALTVSQKLNDDVARELEPAHSLDAAEAVLTRHKVPFERNRGVMTVSGVSRQVVDQIYTLPQGEPFILPNGDGVAICVLRPSADSF